MTNENKMLLSRCGEKYLTSMLDYTLSIGKTYLSKIRAVFNKLTANNWTVLKTGRSREAKLIEGMLICLAEYLKTLKANNGMFSQRTGAFSRCDKCRCEMKLQTDYELTVRVSNGISLMRSTKSI